MFKILLRLKQYRQTYYSRRLLRQLDDRALSDIGVTRSEAMREARRPFWDCKTDELKDDNQSVLVAYSVVSLTLVAGLGLTFYLSF
ncbi:Uncharacterized conserved protein YjiS, DUF1127 family [Amphritea atlantica]|uniref:Uncharacterized conserved protein YjiS, DUF1127 family n=1 Tax=Amphritea atlantica TaxID=355243 RepID=A0A1H9FVY2_9GAMM|nr:DUF1127 domain-containing protein [Amphritea atlantica]SEQ42042.1 Uncharacterized conserved protein YjiS, DUF1127 family [Amphritea atlantica]